LITRETVIIETPARVATSSMRCELAELRRLLFLEAGVVVTI
jgi:hypothetical protein